MLLDPTIVQQRRLISITPLIDVVFILLLFFMLSSVFTRTHQVEFKASAASSTRSAPSDSQRLLLQNQGIVVSASRRYAIDSPEFGELLTTLKDNPSRLIIAAVTDVQVQDLITLVDKARAAGIGNINIAQSVAR